MSMLTTFWKDQNFYIIIVTAILAILNEVMGINVPTEAVWVVVLAILGYVFKDTVERVAIKVAAIRSEGYSLAVTQLKNDK